MQAADFLKIDPKQADEIHEKCPISEGGVERANYVIRKMNRYARVDDNL